MVRVSIYAHTLSYQFFQCNSHVIQNAWDNIFDIISQDLKIIANNKDQNFSKWELGFYSRFLDDSQVMSE